MSTRRRLLAVPAILLIAPSVQAGPLDDAHVADTGFSGPTTGDLTSVYWNPAGLGLMQGPQIMLGGAWQSTSVSVARTSIDRSTGTNPGATTFPTASGSGTLQPFRWPPGPSSFFGIGAGIGHRFGIALAIYSPFSSKLTMNPTADGQEPARYHLVSMDLNHIATTIGLAIHASDSIQIGVAPSLLWPTAHLVFDETTAPSSAPFEDATAAARYDLATKGILVPSYSYLLALGAHYRRGRFNLGLSYTSAPLGTSGAVNLPLDNTQIRFPATLAEGGPGPGICPDGSAGSCLAGQMSYRLPSIYNLGATWQFTQNWSATGIVRWLRYGAHDKITILFSGPSSQNVLGSSVPDHVVLYRGFQDSFDLRGRVVFETKNYRVGGTLRLETSAVPASHVNAAAIDGTKLEPSVAVEMRIWRQIRVSAGYAFTWMFPVDTGTSIFDPTAAAACASAGGDLSTPACQARMIGQARPSAAGTYHLWRQTLSVLTTFGF
ncbi:MAG TPA: outer membrane protein transport protein [Polyangia bacterium]